jgi:hypothetical protein
MELEKRIWIEQLTDALKTYWIAQHNILLMHSDTII